MILFNDASFHGQFQCIDSFRGSLKTLWDARSHFVEKCLQLKVCRSVRQRQVTSSATFNDLLGDMPKEIKVRLLVWLDREGPFWDEDCRHSPDEYFECCGELVTETGAAEAALFKIEGEEVRLFSIDPSNYLFNPLTVIWRGRTEDDLDVDVPNGWNSRHAEEFAHELENPLTNWEGLIEWATRECKHLDLSSDILNQLPRQFISNVANRSKVLLGVLNQIVGSIKDGNKLEFNRMSADWMQGEFARFSPSSESELRDFKQELSFVHPRNGTKVGCSWHGKIKSPQYRIHFEWPLPQGEEKLFVAYIGPKLTKR